MTVFTLYCSGDSEAARHDRVDIDTLAVPFGELMPKSDQTLVGDRPVRLAGGVSYDGDTDTFRFVDGSVMFDEALGRIVTRQRTRYQCPQCGLNVTVTTETWDRHVRPKIDALVGHGGSELALVALMRIVSAS